VPVNFQSKSHSKLVSLTTLPAAALHLLLVRQTSGSSAKRTRNASSPSSGWHFLHIFIDAPIHNSHFGAHSPQTFEKIVQAKVVDDEKKNMLNKRKKVSEKSKLDT